MQVDIHWENKAESILRVNCSGAWNWADIERSAQRWATSNPEAVENYSVLVDIRALTFVPSDVVLQLKNGAQYAKQVNGLVVVLATDTVMTLVFDAFVTMYQVIGGKFRLATSEAEARAILKLADKT